MIDQRTRSLMILARLQAAIGAAIAIVVFAVYGLAPEFLPDATLSLTSAILGTIATVYFLTLHLVLRHTHLALSTAALSVITALNLILVISSTGGLDSPFYSFWLLAIVIAGIFGLREIIIVFSVTLTYYAYQLIREGLHAPYVTD